MSGSILKPEIAVITLTAQEICQACSGELLAGDAAAPVESVSTDTRDDLAGRLFVALKGEHFDGGDFAGEAMERGAMGVVAEAGAAHRLASGLPDDGGDGPVIIAVDDAGEALKRIASVAASKSSARVVAITGSTGKTTTKDILFGLLKPCIDAVAGQASFNNEVGVPLTLLAAGSGTRVIVVEMGMREPGDISELCGIVAPEIAIITNIGPAHLQYAMSLENIARGKAEIAQGLKPGGKLVIPYGEKLLGPHLAGLDVQTVTFGFDTAADVHPAGRERFEGGRLCATISCMGDQVEVCFNFAARHHLLNAMAAMAAYRLLGLPLDGVAAAAGDIRMPRLRGELLELPAGGILINDCYNANPLSIQLSLEHLAAIGAGKRTVAVLGDMAELGSESSSYHRQTGVRVAELGIDCLIAIGADAAGYIEGANKGGGGETACHYFAGRDQALKEVPGLIQAGDAVLVKASRFMQLEQLSDLLTNAVSTDMAPESR